MAGLSVADRLKKLDMRVRAACEACGRDPASVNVLAVSKLQPLNAVREAYDCGLRDFAENYVQEAVEKLGQLESLPVRWHFIGRIQSNKAKALGGGRFAVIHSVDRESIAEALNKAAGGGGSDSKRQDIFLQYNVAGEATKGGAGVDSIESLARFVVSNCPRLRVLGLMAMPPLDEDPTPHFRATREMLRKLNAALSAEERAVHPFDQLSMGTTADFEKAIPEGATWIRIGTDIFGPREEQ